MKKRKTLKAFTLIELIVVIAIIGVLAALLTVVIIRYMREAREGAMIADTRSMVTGANSAVALAVSKGMDLPLDSTYNGVACGVIGNSVMCDAQKNGYDDDSDDAKAFIAYQILRNYSDSKEAQPSFESFGGGGNVPSGMTLDNFISQYSDVNGIQIVYSDAGAILRLEYSSGNMICIYEGDYTVYAAGDSGAAFSAVQ